MPYKIEKVKAVNATSDFVQNFYMPTDDIYEIFRQVEKGVFVKYLEWEYVYCALILVKAEHKVLELQGISPEQLAREAAKLIPREVVRTYD